MVEFMTTSGVGLVKVDAAGNVGIYKTDGTTEEVYIDTSAGTLVVTIAGQAPTLAAGSSFHVAKNAANTIASLESTGNTRFDLMSTTANTFRLGNNINADTNDWSNAGTVTRWNNIATAGVGLPTIYASSIQSQSNAAPTSVSYTPPATAGTYRASYYLDVTTATTITFKAKLTYTDPAGTATTDVIDTALHREGSTTLGYAANTADRYFGTTMFAINNGAGAIAVADNVGTYTTCAYRWAVILEQLA